MNAPESFAQLFSENQLAIARLAQAVFLTAMLNAHFLCALKQRAAVELTLRESGARTLRMYRRRRQRGGWIHR